jgi:hypothetical protein
MFTSYYEVNNCILLYLINIDKDILAFYTNKSVPIVSYSPHMKIILALLYRKYSKMLKYFFYFVLDNKIISGIEDTITEPD